MTATPAAVLSRIRGLVAAEQTGQMPDRQLLERFAARHEEAAFAALVRRHGAMVLGVCRRVLRNAHDAEDAFQATFLVLAQKADQARRFEALGGWLHSVAYRTALKARARAANRRQRERRAGAPAPADVLDEVTGRELLTVLDEELQRLPERFRQPLVLCYLESRTCDEAARHLGWSSRTLKRRLAQGRERLRARLARRGLALSAALLAAGAVTAAVPATLAATTARAAVPVACGMAAAVSAGVAGLLSGAAAPARARIVAAVLLIASLVAAGAGLFAYRAPADDGAARAEAEAPKKEPTVQPAAPDRAAADKEMIVNGTVLGADGKPLAGAGVVVVARPRRQFRGGDPAASRRELLGEGKTGADGRFRLTMPRTSSARYGDLYAVAGAAGHALAWKQLSPDAERPEAVLKLPAEKVIRCTLRDLQGLPAAGVKVVVSRVGSEVNGEFQGISLASLPKRPASWPAPVTTDDKGRLELHGLNREQTILLTISDERFAGQSIEITPVGQKRPEVRGLAIDAGGFIVEGHRGADEKGQPEEPSFTLVPGRVVEGRVLDADTGKPVAGAQVAGVRTGADGRFRLSRAGTHGDFTLVAVGPEGEAYLSVFYRVEWPKGAVKHAVEVKLPRGVPVRGKVTESGTGKSVAGACVQFWPRIIGNGNLRKNVITGWQTCELTRDDGTFQIGVLPGPGYLLIQGPTPDYVHVEEITHEMIYSGKRGGTRLYPDAAVKLDVPAKGEVKEVSVTLRRGATVRGKLVGPDGKPVARALMLHRLYVGNDLGWHFPTEARDGVFEVHGLDPDRAVPVYFLDAEKQCGAVVELSGKQAGQEVTVKLAPCGQATARYVDGQGQPLANYPAAPQIVVTPGRWGGHGLRDEKSEEVAADEALLTNIDRHNYWDRVKTDARGRVTFPALIPGATYRLGRFDKDHWALHKEFRAESGQTVDLGDVPITKEE